MGRKKKLFRKRTLAIFIAVFSVPLVILFGLNYIDVFQKQKEIQRVEQSTEALMDKMKKMLDEEKTRLNAKPLEKDKVTQNTILKLPPVVTQKQEEVKAPKKQEDHRSEINDYKKSLEAIDKKPVKVVKKKYKPKGKPKLAIIIDDVAYPHQVRKIQAIPYKVTPSFFPPTSRHPDTVKLSQKFEFSMVHLPLQAISYVRPEPGTLNVEDSKQTIRKRIQELKATFPHLSYYNNHTGSKFTANYTAMDRLISVMQSEKLVFVDSRTTAQTKVPQVFEKHKLTLFSRDIFLDNKIEKSAIRKQLKKL